MRKPYLRTTFRDPQLSLMGLYNIAAHQKPKSYPRCLDAPKRWNRFNASQSASTCLDPTRNRSVNPQWKTIGQRIAGLLLLLGPALFFGLAVKDCRAQPVRAQVSVPSFSKADFISSIATICRRSLQTAAALHVTAGAITGPCRR